MAVELVARCDRCTSWASYSPRTDPAEVLATGDLPNGWWAVTATGQAGDMVRLGTKVLCPECALHERHHLAVEKYLAGGPVEPVT